MEDSKDMDIDDSINTLLGEGARIVIAGDELSPNAPVPTCPGWTVRDLLRHLGGIHRWAYDIVTHQRQHRPNAEEMRALVGPLPSDEDLVPWVSNGLQQLVGAFKEASPELECFQVFPVGTSLQFWTRRQAHETTIHRVDVESARGDEISSVKRGFAADGIDELLTGFHARTKSDVRSPIPSLIHIRATDAEVDTGSWYVHLSDVEPPRVTRTATARPDCVVSGPLELLYLALWNRLPFTDLEVEGNLALLQLWRSTSAIKWRGPSFT
ncbi:maleylpyruvate isomerase family mycothiol-dependent enzyme [Natronoglycomyces albus]|uniref:Maleylpyruvate isomerase family mycothiol-dependent enzyme n=1 Tax=Natronoglycomyces albus TaxID=2811108 RepID=A0A895XHC5_9ACTN|nr:maleylpyruvate isomerase family mycothiol-dependent enzyme [Natronoglycomyces albus]QSB04327.1 maleylpyruvate isomerase family mycothiol-dependent enzyme [Natronoglycomyces albus]